MAATKKGNTNYKIIWVVLAIVVVVAAILFTPRPNSNSTNTQPSGTMSQGGIVFDFDNMTIPLNNEELVLVDGSYATLDHKAQMTSRYANPSGTKAVAILEDAPGGSGTFYYLVGASLQGNQQQYSKPVLLGDRIVIETVSVDEDTVTVDYLTRPEGSPMAAEPTEAMSVTYSFQPDGSLQLVQ